MGREVRRVPLDFDWPLDKVWKGYVMDDELKPDLCPECKGDGRTVFGEWIGGFTYVMAMLASDVHERIGRQSNLHPWLAEFGRAAGHWEYLVDGEWRHVAELQSEGHESEFFRAHQGRWVVDRPGDDALDFFHGIMRKHYELRYAQDDEYAKYYSPDTLPSREEIGGSFGLSSRGTGTVNIQAALLHVLEDAAEVSFDCPICWGNGSLDKYEGQEADRDAWEKTEPPEGEGYQLWETVTEGSPISPVFETPEELARYMVGMDEWGTTKDYQTALNFVGVGWAPTGMNGMDGVTAVGRAK